MMMNRAKPNFQRIWLLFIVGLLLSGGVLIVMSKIIHHDITSISSIWLKQEYSKKTTLINNLRGELGFGGMIHDFKNYILRGNPSSFASAQEHLNNAMTDISRYKTLTTNSTENQALTDLTRTLEIYRQSFATALTLTKQGALPMTIDQQVKVDDSAALEAILSLTKESTPPKMLTAQSKASSINALRGAIGYGGMIHEFKNYVLRGDGNNSRDKPSQIKAQIENAHQALNHYSRFKLAPDETEAISQIKLMLNNYINALNAVTDLSNQGLSPKQIDRQVRINDLPTYAAFNTINRHLFSQNMADQKKGYDALSLVSVLAKYSFWITSGLIIFLLVIAFRTIRALKQQEQTLQDSEEHTAAIVENIVDGIIVITSRGSIVQYNKAAEAIFGYSAAEMIGKNISLLMPKADSEKHDQYLNNYHNGANPKIIGIGREVRGQRKDGSTFPMSLAVSEIKWGKGKAYTGIIRDITQFKENEKNLQEAYQAAESANQAKTKFLSSMSHELRTPLNAILGFAQLLQINQEATLTTTQVEFSEHIVKAGTHLLALINGVLDLEKIEANDINLSLENINLAEIFSDCRTLLDGIANTHNITLTFESTNELPPVFADYTRTKQVIINLISNAIKYNSDGGTVTVSAQQTTEDMLRIVVTDTGVGIPEEKQSDLFQAFNRLGMENKGIEGTGIGLVISRQLTEAMDGRLGFESSTNQGSRFWIELPISKHGWQSGNMDEQRSNANITLPKGHTTLLYIEDNPSNLKLVDVIIQLTENISMISAHSGELGIEMAKDRNPEVILLDLNLPGMDGHEVLKELQQLEQTHKIPVIALTASASKGDIRKGLEAGFFRYMTKPLDIDEFLKNISDSLNTKH
jgi:PAS domain S-box-containing protein